MKRAPTLLIGALAMVAVSASAAWACSCVRYKSAAEQYAKGQLIFIGRADGREVLSRDGGPPPAATRFVVQRTLKGEPQKMRRIVHGEATGGMCGIRFQRGRTYLVIAYRNEGRWRTNSCSAPQFPRAEFERLAQRGR
ncbi:hypothetical protein GVN21_13860 [Caulobacter sp. SLTY]|uniref:hypothetical protein n=1 Tax=Caulobacter sp. SLTY TaxID=2683262 RepID=UPI00141218F4|nr:hypothetical protein [Caulobacter sp. SLTY]NBB16447.1 hypothetical protein [Caulobacter sp. SLTY]